MIKMILNKVWNMIMFRETITLIIAFVSFLGTYNLTSDIVYLCFLLLVLNMSRLLPNINRQTNKLIFFKNLNPIMTQI
jgi:hypothetical protein